MTADRERIEREARSLTSYVDGWCPANVRDVLAERIAARIAREVERAVRDEREAWKQTRANFLEAKQALRDERDATRALLAHAIDALESFNATEANELRAAAIRARSAQGGERG